MTIEIFIRDASGAVRTEYLPSGSHVRLRAGEILSFPEARVGDVTLANISPDLRVDLGGGEYVILDGFVADQQARAPSALLPDGLLLDLESLPPPILVLPDGRELASADDLATALGLQALADTNASGKSAEGLADIPTAAGNNASAAPQAGERGRIGNVTATPDELPSLNPVPNFDSNTGGGNFTAKGPGNETPASSQTTDIPAITDTTAAAGPGFTVGFGASTVAEGGSIVITIARSGDTSAAASVDYTTGSGGATDGVDYVHNNGTIAFSAGQTFALVTIQSNADALFEGNETFQVTLSNPSAGTPIAVPTATATISDANAAPTFTIGGGSTNEGGNIVFTVTRAGDAEANQTVAYSLGGGSAGAGDYNNAGGSVTFSQGQTSATFTVQTNQDALFEGDETFLATITNPVGGTTSSTTGTIINDDAAPTFSISGGSASEGSGIVFTVTRSGDAQANQVVSYNLADGSAVGGTDYTAGGGTVTFAQGQTTATFTVATTQDSLFEADEAFTATIANPIGGATSSATGTITNNDPAPGFSVSGGSATEGNGVVFTVSRSGDAQANETVDFATANGTAGGTDYTGTSQTLTFTAGQTFTTVTVATTQDSLFEGNETFSATLSNATGGASITGTNATGTITNDDGAPTFAISGGSANEGSGIVFTVTRSGDAEANQTVNYTLGGGNAAGGTDYDNTAGAVTFTQGQTVATFTVQSNGDLSVETDETFTATITNPVTAATAAATGTIVDATTFPNFSITGGSTTEGNGVVFTVVRSGDVSGGQTVDFATANGTAGSGDYTGVSQTLSFSAGQTFTTVTVATTQDSLFEGNETFSATLSNPSGSGIIVGANAIGTIVDDDAAPTFSIGGGSATEGNGVVFTVTRTGDAEANQTVSYSLGGGSASTGDYDNTGGSVTFSQGQTSATFTVQTNQDALFEGDETFNATISNPVGGATSAATGTILNDDAAPSFSVTGGSANEGSGVVFTVTRSGDAQATETVDFATSNGTAGAGDYTGVSQTLTFTTGQTFATVTVATAQDSLFEADETFGATLSNATGGTSIVGTTATGTIVNDDAAPSFSVSGGSATEGSSVVFTVTRSGDAQANETVDFATSNGTAGAGDYTSVSQTLTFTTGQTIATVTVTTAQDSLFETDEIFSGTLSNATGGATIIGSTATGTIGNDDTAPSFAISSSTPSAFEGSGIVFTVTRSGDAQANQTVDFVTGNATAGASDYTGVTQTLTFTTGQTFTTVTVNTSTDALTEGNETFSASLSNTNFGTITTPSVTGTIIDAAGFSITAGSSVIETGSLIYTVTRTGDISQAQSVTYATGGGTASVGSDYTSASGTLSFTAGQTVATITVSTLHDLIQETGGETVQVTLSNPTNNGVILSGTASGTIIDQFNNISLSGDSGYYSQGASFADYDNDGDLDIFVANDVNNPATAGAYSASHLWRNNGDGTFTSMTVSTLATSTNSSTSSVAAWSFAREGDWGDYDGDGDLDVYVTRNDLRGAGATAYSQLYRNDGNGNFTEVTAAAGLSTTDHFGFNSTWGDFDGDGRLDIFTERYSGSTLANQLWHNNGDGTFSAVSVTGLTTSVALYRSPTFVDYDRDGDLDIQVLGDNVDRIYRNDGNGAFTLVATPFSTGGIHLGSATWGDYDGDGRLDVAISTYSGGSTEVWHNTAGGFVNVSASAFGGALSSNQAIGTQWLDYNSDGRLDLYIATGVQNQLWLNNGDGTFTQRSIGNDGGASTRPAWGDIDNDGDVDLYVPNFGAAQQNVFWQNNSNPSAGSYLNVDLESSTGGQNLHGAIVDLFDQSGAHVATRIYDGNEPLTFYGLTNQNYSLTVSYYHDADGLGAGTGTHVIVGATNGFNTGFGNVNTVNSDFGNINPTVVNGTVHLAADTGYSASGVNLHGGAGADRFFSGTGNDTFTGNGGQDTYVFHANPGHDTVTDFTAGNGANHDRLDIADLLSGYGGPSSGPGTLTALQNGGFLQFTQNGADVDVKVDTNGGGDNFQTVVTLSNVNLASLVDENVTTSHS